MDTNDQLTSLNVSLPVSQKEYVKGQVAATGCSTPSEYIRRLIHADQKTHARERLEQLLLEGLNSGEPVEVTAEDWAELRSEFRRRLAEKQGNK